MTLSNRIILYLTIAMLLVAIIGTVAIKRLPEPYYGQMVDLHLRGGK